MALAFLEMVIAVLFAMSFFHRLHKRSVSTFIVLFIAFVWVVFYSFGKGDYGLWLVSSGLIFTYWRAMRKPPSDKIL